MFSPAYIKNYLKNTVWDKFRAQELWFRDIDYYFWAYEVDNNKIYSTKGYFENDTVYYSTIQYENIDIDKLIQEKFDEGYYCFASELVV
jgi:hypothetical protein